MSEPGEASVFILLNFVFGNRSSFELSRQQILGIPLPVRVSGETSGSSLESRVLPGGLASEWYALLGLMGSCSSGGGRPGK